MKRALTALAFSGLMAFGFAAMAPSAQASAFSAAGSASNAMAAAGEAAGSDLVQVTHRRRHWDDHRRWRRHHWRHDRYWRARPRSGFYLEFGTGGFRHARPPYYAPPRYVAPRRAYGLSSAHVNWCYARYRSYRAADNTFQPYNGPRRACISPYWR